MKILPGMLRTMLVVALFSITFVQSCLAWPAFVASENFESANGTIAPYGWAYEQVTGSLPGISFVTSATNPLISAAYSETKFVSYNSFNITAGSTRLRQSIAKSTLNRAYVMVDFAWYEDPGNPSATDMVDVQWSTNGTTWNTAATFYRYNAVAGWKTKNVLLPPEANNQPVLYIAFLFTSGSGGNCALDNVFESAGPLVLETATIGTGTVSSKYPYTTFWMGGRTQMLYTAAELSSAGLTAGNITFVGFNVISNSTQVMNGFNLKLGTTALTTLSGGYVNDLTSYYTAPYSVPGTGWRNINLATPFNWNGTSNVIVEICYANTTYSNYSPVYSTTMTGKVSGHFDDLQTECSTSTNNAPTARPNIQFGFPSPQLGVLRGVVRVAATLAPVPMAIVIYGSQRDTCDIYGSYVLYNMPAGPVTVTGTSTGYLNGTSTTDITFGTVNSVDILLNPGPMLSGVVTDLATGAPIIGARVSVGPGVTNITYSVTGGAYTTPPILYSGVLPIVVSKPGYEDVVTTISVSPNANLSQDFSLLPAAVQPGTCTATFDDPGNPNIVNLSWEAPQGIYELLYDDGIQDNFAIWPAENNLNALKFTPLSWPAKITGGSVDIGISANYSYNAFPFVPFKIFAYKADGPGGMPGTLLDSVLVSPELFGWSSFTFGTPITLNSGEFYLVMKQAGTQPHVAGLAVDATNSQSRSFACDVNSGGTWTPVPGNFMIRARVQGDGGPMLNDNPAGNDNPQSLSYEVWRLKQGQEDNQAMWVSIWAGAGTTASDFAWPIFPDGAWRWAVKAVYSTPVLRSSAPTFSNVMGKNWIANVDVCVGLSCAATPIEGTSVILSNTSYPDTVYNAITDNSGCVHFSNVWKGNYTLKVVRFSYPTYSQSVTILANASFNVAMVIQATAPTNLTVNNTNLVAAWNRPETISSPLNESWAGGSFTTNQWVVSGGINWKIYSYNGNPEPCATFASTPRSLNYDQYLTSKSYVGEHAPVMSLSYDISLSNHNASDLNTLSVELWDGTTWTVLETYNNANGDFPWISESIDISAVTNSFSFKIRFHASGPNSYDINYWFIDNVQIKNSQPSSDSDPCVTGYNVYLNNVLLGSTPDTSYAIPPGMVTYGQPYNLCVATVYGTTVSTQLCTAFTSQYLYPPLDLAGSYLTGTTTLTWSPPSVPTGLTGYNIYRNNVLLNTSPISELTYFDTPVPYGMNTYTVRAVYGASESLNAGPVVINAVPAQYSVGDLIVNAGVTVCYNALQTVSVAGNGTTFQVETGGQATMIAGQNILYFPGTSVNIGGYMWGYIAPSGPYCLVPSMPVASVAPAPNSQDNHDLALSIHPNPTSGRFMVSLKGEQQPGETTVKVFNVMGKIVLIRTMYGEQSFSLSLANQPAGVYIIRIVLGNKVESGKIVKQ